MGRVYGISEFATLVGRSVSTVRRWETEGRIVARRNATGQRYFDDGDVRAVLAPGSARDGRTVIAYCRVSSTSDRAGLSAQREDLEAFCAVHGLVVDEWVSEIGRGSDLMRPQLLDVMTRVKAGQVSTLIVADRDRLATVGCDYLAYEAETAGCALLVAHGG